MKRKMLLLVGVIIALLVAGCGQNGGNANQSGASGRELVVAVPVGVSILDPHKTGELADIRGFNQVFDTLVTLDKDRKIVPSLAEKYEVSPDGITYTFYLRKGVKFSNGLEFKASDAKFSIDRAMNSSFTSYGFISVKSVEIVDDYTIKIHMKTPDIPFLEGLTCPYYGKMVSEEVVKKYGDQFAKTPESIIGTGPYIVKEWKPGELVVYEANPNYFKGAPDIKKVRMKTITDINAAIIALQTGEIGTYLDDTPAINNDAIEKSNKLNLVSYPPYNYAQVVLNEKGMFKDVNMRRAIAYAIDREKANKVYTEGKGAIIDYPGAVNFTGDPNLKNLWYPLDIEKAKQLVKDAGMEGKTATIKAFSPYDNLATAIQDDLSKIGLNVKVQMLEVNAFSDQVYKNGDFDLCITYWPSTIKDMDSVMSWQYKTENFGYNGNIGFYSNPTMDELLTKAKGVVDPEARKQLYGEAVKLFVKDVPMIPLFYSPAYRPISKDLVIDKGLVEYNNLYYYKWNH